MSPIKCLERFLNGTYRKICQPDLGECGAAGV